MLFHSVDRIWRIEDTYGAIPTPRNGIVRLQDDEIVSDIRDAERAIHVHGLLPGDFAVFMSFKYRKDARAGKTLGYLVGTMDEDTGDGILVHDDSLELFPTVWMTDEIRYALGKLSASDLADFNLTELAQK